MKIKNQIKGCCLKVIVTIWASADGRAADDVNSVTGSVGRPVPWKLKSGFVLVN